MQLSELKKRMKGVMVVQATPFNKDGSLDLEGLQSNTRWLAEYAAGKDFIFTPVGSTGEFYAMSDDECKAAIKAVVEVTAGRATIMAGAGRAGTRETIKVCRDAESAGADGAMVILPYYHVPTEEGMYQHYKQVAESVGKDFGIMVYNNPYVSGSWIKPPLMAKLSKITNIIALKNVTPNILPYFEMKRALDPKDTVILCSSGEEIFSSSAALYGSAGHISDTANFFPDHAYSVYEATTARDFNKAAKIIDSFIPYYSFMDKATANHSPHTGVGTAGGNLYISLMKASMDIVGLRGGEPRLPLVGLNNEEKDELRDILRAMKVIK